MDELVAQVDQLRAALAVAEADDKAGIESMIRDLEELMGMTQSETGDAEDSGNRSVDEEMRLFQEEIAALGQEATGEEKSAVGSEPTSGLDADAVESIQEPGSSQAITSEQGTADVTEELSSLVGMQCRAPHESKWQQIGYYNAIVLDVEHEKPDSVDDILVRVMFSHPLTEKMKPCQFYLEGRCKFDDDNCKYSHGEIVPFLSLKEYVEPEFSKVKHQSKVIAKYSDGLWYEATVQEILEDGNCRLIYNSYKEESVLPLHETFPMFGDSEDISSDESDDEVDASDFDGDEIVPISSQLLLQIRTTTALGDWEKHTRGMGSKLMAKMGYVTGTGLGRYGEGRVDPVDAVVLPPGRSLDACMELKERFGTENLFSAEKRLKRMQRKEAQRAKVEKEKQKRNESVFNFLNSKLGNNSKALKLSKDPNSIKKEDLAKDTNKNLGARMLRVGQSIKSVSKEIEKLKESVKRHEDRDQKAAEAFRSSLKAKEDELERLKRSETFISGEQKARNDKKRLSVF